MPPPGPIRRVATLDIDPSSGEVRRVERAGAPDAASLALGRADVWELVLSLDGRPCSRLVVPDPGAAGEGAIQAAVLAACRADRSRELIARSLRHRMGAVTPAWPAPTVSVIVCTRGRPSSLAELLDALAELDPAPSEIILVDNAPAAGADCRDLANGAGALYVREDAPGLNRARRAGIAAATGELLAFTDDDCLPPRGWLSVLPELFANPNVGAATGPAFPAGLDTRAELRFERAASFSRGLARSDLDFMALSPPLATRAGAGANVVLRRELLDRLGDVFPAELDAGTETRSGGDAYALFRVLAAGARVAYDPRLYTYHRHRSDPGRLHDAVRGYGVGLGALATKLLVEDREPDALRIFRWLLSQYVRTMTSGLAGARDPVEVRLAWDYLRGGLAGPGAWRRSRRHRGNAVRPPASRHEHGPSGAGAQTAPPAGRGVPRISVVVVTNRPGELPAQCLAALARQADAPAFETVLVDDSPPGTATETTIPPDLSIRQVRTGGVGAAAARNAGSETALGDLLVFLDDDLVPAPNLLATHWSRHRDGAETVVVGYSPPRPLEPNLVALSASLWWEDHFRAREEESAPTFTSMLSGNVSVARKVFERVGRFDAEFGLFRREDWEWGIRALTAGVGIAYEPDAVAEHRFRLDSAARLAAARAEGAGDALLAKRHPFVLASIPGGTRPSLFRASERLAFRLMVNDGRRARAVRALDLLERFRLRSTWARWFAVAQRAAYEAGFRSGGGASDGADARAGAVAVELCSQEPVAPPQVAAPALKLEVAGRPAGYIAAIDGQWTAALAERGARRVPRTLLEQPETCLEPRAEGSNLPEATIVQVPDGESMAARWRSIRAQADGSAVACTFVPLKGTEITDEILERATPLLGGERVALVFGGALQLGHFPGPALVSRATVKARFPLVGSPTRYLAVRSDAYRELGGFDPEAAAFGELGPVLEFVDRALEAGWTVGHCDVPGPMPARGIAARLRTAELERWRSRGGLVRDRARTLGVRWWLANGLAPVLARLLQATRPGGPRLRGAVGVAVAFFVGSLARN